MGVIGDSNSDSSLKDRETNNSGRENAIAAEYPKSFGTQLNASALLIRVLIYFTQPD